MFVERSSWYSLIIQASFSDSQVRCNTDPVPIISFMFFVSFFLSASQIPWYMKEFKYFSIFKYAYHALIRDPLDLSVHLTSQTLRFLQIQFTQMVLTSIHAASQFHK